MGVITTIRHRAAIAGHVVDAVSGLGIGDALITIPALDIETHSRPDGFYAFLDLPDGAYALTATAPALGRRYGSVTVGGIVVASTADGRPILDPKGRLPLPPTRLRGTVHRADTSAPIPRAQVRLRASAVAVLCDATGSYHVDALEAGTQTAVVTASGFISHSEQVVLTVGEEAILNFNLNTS